jgi:hypothetical protein
VNDTETDANDFHSDSTSSPQSTTWNSRAPNNLLSQEVYFLIFHPLTNRAYNSRRKFWGLVMKGKRSQFCRFVQRQESSLYIHILADFLCRFSKLENGAFWVFLGHLEIFQDFLRQSSSVFSNFLFSSRGSNCITLSYIFCTSFENFRLVMRKSKHTIAMVTQETTNNTDRVIIVNDNCSPVFHHSTSIAPTTVITTGSRHTSQRYS